MTDLTAPLLVTKLHIPTLRSRWVERQRLLDRLLGQPDARLVLLSAPPGYGKTSLLAEWCRLLAAQHVRVAWLSLEEQDNDALRFWRYVIAAFQSLPGGARLGENLLDLLRLPEPPPLTHLLALLINELAAFAGELVLVLDDYHTITDPEIHAGMAFLLDHLPGALRVVIASRSTPDLPLPRLRARGQVLELHAADLRFTPDESARFLRQVMGLDLAGADLAALDQRTEGWAAGLQLAALSFRGSPSGAPAQPFGGGNRYVLDYLTAEVLSRQPREVQEFLLESAVLSRLSGALCDAVLQKPAGVSQAILERLEAANLFIVPLDNQRGWYRYHHLFADLLRRQLERQSPGLAAALHRRAAEWFEAQGLIDEAVQHACLSDLDLAVRIIEDNYIERIGHFDYGPLVQWLGALPEERILARPALCLAQAWVFLFRIQNERCDGWLEKADAVMHIVSDPDELRFLRGQAAAIRSTVAVGRNEHEQALVYARQALDNLTSKITLLRALVQLNIGDAYMGSNFEVSAQALRAAIALSRESINPGFTMICAGSLVNLFLNHGRLREATQAYQEAHDLEAAWLAQGGKPLPETGKLLGSYAQILYQWNDLETAREIAGEAVLRCEEWGHNDHILDAYLILARIQQARGLAEEANAVLAQARVSLEEYSRRVQSRSLLAREKKLQRSMHNVALQGAFVALMQDRLEDVERWVEERGVASRPEQASLAERVLWAWLSLRRGQAAQTLPLLEDAAADYEQRDYPIYAARTLALLAWARQESGQAERALAALARAVHLAQPEGCLAPFLEIGGPLAGPLERLAHRLDGSAELHAYLRGLRAALAAQPGAPPRPPAAGERLVEPLTERELDVLRLIALGRSNGDIAAALCVSLNTVKTHTKHLFAKLDAGSRVEMVEKSRRLGLL